MPIRDNDLLVYFGKYCKTCKHEKLGRMSLPVTSVWSTQST